MPRRNGQFPSTIDGCEQLLNTVPVERGTQPSGMSGSMNFGTFIPAHEHETFPYHDTELFVASGALLGAYGANILPRKNTLFVHSISNTNNPVDRVYRVKWEWKRPILKNSSTMEWFVDSRGENYSPKYAAAMALFRTYYNQLSDQADALKAWQTREAEARAYMSTQRIVALFDAIVELNRDAAVQRVLAKYPDKTKSDLTEPNQEEITAMNAAATHTKTSVLYGPFENCPGINHLVPDS